MEGQNPQENSSPGHLLGLRGLSSDTVREVLVAKF